MNVLFLNNPPLITNGIQWGFDKIGCQTQAPTFWEWQPAEKQAKLACRWVDENAFVPDILFLEGFNVEHPIHLETIRALKKKTNAFMFYWAIDDPWLTQNVLRGRPGPYAQVADHILTTTVESIPIYNQVGITSSLLTFACNPEFHRPVEPEQELQCDILMIANNYDKRAEWTWNTMVAPAMNVAKLHDLTFHLYGKWWDTTNRHRRYSLKDRPDVWKGSLEYDKLPAAYSSCRVALGAELCLNESITQSSMRIFEALGSGACYLGPRHRAHEALFVDREEAVYASNGIEVDRALKWVLSNDRRAQAIARAGHQKCHKLHTYDQRVVAVQKIWEDKVQKRAARSL